MTATGGPHQPHLSRSRPKKDSRAALTGEDVFRAACDLLRHWHDQVLRYRDPASARPEHLAALAGVFAAIAAGRNDEAAASLEPLVESSGDISRLVRSWSELWSEGRDAEVLAYLLEVLSDDPADPDFAVRAALTMVQECDILPVDDRSVLTTLCFSGLARPWRWPTIAEVAGRVGRDPFVEALAGGVDRAAREVVRGAARVMLDLAPVPVGLAGPWDLPVELVMCANLSADEDPAFDAAAAALLEAADRDLLDAGGRPVGWWGRTSPGVVLAHCAPGAGDGVGSVFATLWADEVVEVRSRAILQYAFGKPTGALIEAACAVVVRPSS